MTEVQSSPGIRTGSVCWQSPSNIAIVKYWGKHGEQLPINPSVSVTLQNAYTKTRVEYEVSGNSEALDFFFHGERNPAFARRLEAYVRRLSEDYPQLKEYAFRIYSENSFPHSAGIASSASAMSALALCLCSVAQNGKHNTDAEFIRDVSNAARLGSGSACRSVVAPFALWGSTPEVPGSNDRYAVPVEVDALFTSLQDTILIVDDTPKAISSSHGHTLMREHIFAGARLRQAQDHLSELLKAVRDGDVGTFGEITEAEALSLHAMMMTSKPSFVLMKPATLAIIREIRNFRAANGIPVYFTLDAGPNVHVLYCAQDLPIIKPWIEGQLLDHCTGQKVIYDRAGSGPRRLS